MQNLFGGLYLLLFFSSHLWPGFFYSLLHLPPLRFHCVGGCAGFESRTDKNKAWSVRASNHLARSLPPSQDLIQTAVKCLDFSWQPQSIHDDISGLSCFCRLQKTCGGGEKRQIVTLSLRPPSQDQDFLYTTVGLEGGGTGGRVWPKCIFISPGTGFIASLFHHAKRFLLLRKTEWLKIHCTVHSLQYCAVILIHCTNAHVS